MNLFQGANASATFLILATVVTGLGFFISDKTGSIFVIAKNNPSVFLLALFIVLFRIKSGLDDHKHFGEEVQGKLTSRYIGFILAILTWILFALAGFFLRAPLRAAEFVGLGFLLSTAWIAIHIGEILIDKDRRNNEVITSLLREKWIIINVLYILCIVGYLGWYDPFLAQGNTSSIIALLIILFFDMITSRSYNV